MEYYSRITDVLEWGARIWANVDVVERGVVFEKTFIRGVNRMKLSAMYTVSLLFCACRSLPCLK